MNGTSTSPARLIYYNGDDSGHWYVVIICNLHKVRQGKKVPTPIALRSRSRIVPPSAKPPEQKILNEIIHSDSYPPAFFFPCPGPSVVELLVNIVLRLLFSIHWV